MKRNYSADFICFAVCSLSSSFGVYLLGVFWWLRVVRPRSFTGEHRYSGRTSISSVLFKIYLCTAHNLHGSGPAALHKLTNCSRYFKCFALRNQRLFTHNNSNTLTNASLIVFRFYSIKISSFVEMKDKKKMAKIILSFVVVR